MNNRTKQFWIPALVSLAISEGVLLVSTFTVRSHPHLLLMGPRMIYLPWLVSLPIAGAMGAYLSRRAGSQRRILLTASLFPALMALCFICVAIAVTLITGTRIFARPQWLYVMAALRDGVCIPAVALLLGSLPFWKQRELKA